MTLYVLVTSYRSEADRGRAGGWEGDIPRRHNRFVHLNLTNCSLAESSAQCYDEGHYADEGSRCGYAVLHVRGLWRGLRPSTISVLTFACIDLPAKDVAGYRESSGSLGSHDLDALAVMGARNLVCRRDDI